MHSASIANIILEDTRRYDNLTRIDFACFIMYSSNRLADWVTIIVHLKSFIDRCRRAISRPQYLRTMNIDYVYPLASSRLERIEKRLGDPASSMKYMDFVTHGIGRKVCYAGYNRHLFIMEYVCFLASPITAGNVGEFIV